MISMLKPMLAAAMVSATVTSAALGQTEAHRIDSLRLGHFRIRAEATDSCVVLIFTTGRANNQESPTGETNIETRVAPQGLRLWIDSATTYRGRTARPSGNRLRYAWMPLYGVGIERAISDRSDVYTFVMTGYALPMSAPEIPLLVTLFDSAATRTMRLSNGRKCPAYRP
jgi:hypothetical protein